MRAHPSADLLVHCVLVFSESNLIADLHLQKQPVWVALQNFGQMHTDVAGGLPEPIHNPAQGGFVDAQHARQAVLTDARGVHPQLQIRINVSIQCHGLALDFYSATASFGEQE